jgi:hypothetical protein
MIGSMTSLRERIGWPDVVVTAIACALAVVYMVDDVTDDRIQASWAVVPVGVLMALPLLWRRVAPAGALAGVLGALLLNYAIFGEVVRCGLALPVMLLLVFAAGSRLDRPATLWGLALALAISVAVCLTDGPYGAPLAALTFLAPVTLAVWGVGRIVRSRGQLVTALESRTHELRVARDERSRLEVATERARLSAELDELLQRRLGALAQLAEGGSQGSNPEVALAEIERESRRTLEEMRAVVGVLRNDEDDAPIEPQPTLTHLEAMLVRAKGDGARLKVEGSLRALPAGVELSAYRIVEQLLEALADTPSTEVCVRFADDALELSVVGSPRRRNAEAIERTRERVRLHHGTLQASTDQGRAEFVVSLPLFAAV